MADTKWANSSNGQHVENKTNEQIVEDLNKDHESKSAREGSTTDVSGRRFEKVSGKWMHTGDTPLATYGGVSEDQAPAGYQVRRHPNTYKQRVPDRIQKLMIGILVWVFLAFWSMASFLEHIESIYGNSKYINMAKVGALGAEVVLLCLIILKCYNKHLRVRAAALFSAIILGIFILLHSGTLRSTGAQEAENKRAQEAYTGAAERIVKTATATAADSAVKTQAEMKGQGLSQRERMAAGNNLRAGAQATAKELAAGVKTMIDDGQAKVFESSIFPPWYVQQWMYIAVFAFAMACLGFVLIVWMFAGDDDVDENFDGIADKLQPHLFPQYARSVVMQGYTHYPGQYPPGK